MTARRGFTAGDSLDTSATQAIYRPSRHAARVAADDGPGPSFAVRATRRLQLDDTTTIRPGLNTESSVVTTLIRIKPVATSRKKRIGLFGALVPVTLAAALATFSFFVPQTSGQAPQLALIAQAQTRQAPAGAASTPIVEQAATLAPAAPAAAEAKKTDADIKAAFIAARNKELSEIAYAIGVADQMRKAVTQVDPPASVGAPVQVADGAVILPVDNFKMSSPFGWRIHPITGEYSFHYGNDLTPVCNYPIVAAASGVVTFAGWNGDLGRYVAINHGKFSTGYAHQAKLVVTVGQHVTQGQLIGYVGTSGLSTGCHVHWAAINAKGQYFDALTLVH